ncbi:oocyte zinc finger protein XlCOF6-like [Oncorhynchus tshawytscha]|uniref:C2H2-type domain-containing protein n=1 Tax=Oncorhynchus tshawytscha TaxID=74940 RepID=A0AAZ3S6B2_ONCTS|nr:oocyte zinc finger protein XlCOF6-like [Oncorhynchus tshawytscha]
MAKLQSLSVFVNTRLTVATVEIMGAVEKMVAEYQEEIFRSKVENDRLRRLLRIRPEMKRCRLDSLQFSLTVSEEEVNPVQQQCDQEEWNSSLGTDDPEPMQIKEENAEVGTTQVAGQLQGLEPDIVEFMFTPSCVKSDCDQDDLPQSLTLSQTTTVENRESDSKKLDLKPFGTVTHLDNPYDPRDNQDNVSSHSSAASSDLVGFDISPPLDPNPPLRKPSTTSKTHDCGKILNCKGSLNRHMQTSTGEKSFSCNNCRKSFSRKDTLNMHIRTHTGEKPFVCGDCGKSFRQKATLNRHIRTHTGEKPFSCGACGKSFNHKGNLTVHLLTHTGETPFTCGDCGKSFRQKYSLKKHTSTHIGETFNCAHCGISFRHKVNLDSHILAVHK